MSATNIEKKVVQQFSHDINNLIAGIQGYARYLRAEGHVHVEGQYFLNQLVLIADKAAQKVRNLQLYLFEEEPDAVSDGIIPDAASRRAESRIPTQIFSGEYNILVIDDEPAVRESVKSLLEREGYSVYLAADGLEGIEAFQQNNFDAVLLDLSMPFMSGNLVFARLKAIDDTVPVILFSAFITDSRIKEFTDFGVFHFIEKPFQQEELLRIVRDACSSNDQKGLVGNF